MFRVALRKESVDRNFHIRDTASARPRSLSARRAWIEILLLAAGVTLGGLWVALRKESVDRNIWVNKTQSPPSVALRKESVDRNIILQKINIVNKVALRKESVDRNVRNGSKRRTYQRGRSPQGERG